MSPFQRSKAKGKWAASSAKTEPPQRRSEKLVSRSEKLVSVIALLVDCLRTQQTPQLQQQHILREAVYQSKHLFGALTINIRPEYSSMALQLHGMMLSGFYEYSASLDRNAVMVALGRFTTPRHKAQRHTFILSLSGLLLETVVEQLAGTPLAQHSPAVLLESCTQAMGLGSSSSRPIKNMESFFKALAKTRAAANAIAVAEAAEMEKMASAREAAKAVVVAKAAEAEKRTAARAAADAVAVADAKKAADKSAYADAQAVADAQADKDRLELAEHRAKQSAAPAKVADSTVVDLCDSSDDEPIEQSAGPAAVVKRDGAVVDLTMDSD